MEDAPHFSSESFLSLNEGTSRTTCEGEPRKSFHQDRRKNFEKPQYNCFNSSIFENPHYDAFKEPSWKRAPSYSCGIVGLHEEINDFYEFMRPTNKETDIRLKVVEHITHCVHSLWPQAEVEVFGSYRTGLYLPSSDIDMVIFGEWKSLPLHTLKKCLSENGIYYSDIEVIANASVPLVRLTHSPSRVRVDISFNMKNGIQSAKFIKKLIKEFPVLPKLVLVLKQFLVHRGLNEVYSGGMSSYCLTLMIVSFLKDIHRPKTEPSVNLGTLLLEFFEHYGVNFNYERVSINFEGGGCYKPKDTVECYLSIKDPIRPEHDVAKGSYLMHLLKTAFQNSYHLLSKAVIESAETNTQVKSFLHLIFKIDAEVLEKRQMMLSNYSRIIRVVTELIDKLNESSYSEEPSYSTAAPSTSSKNFKKLKSL